MFIQAHQVRKFEIKALAGTILYCPKIRLTLCHEQIRGQALCHAQFRYLRESLGLSFQYFFFGVIQNARGLKSVYAHMCVNSQPKG